jgi:hypothetical protein
MIPETHHGYWHGPNRLWMEDPSAPKRSDGSIDAAATTLRYRWSLEDKPHEGLIELSGPPGAVAAQWKDSFHASDGMQLHGLLHDGQLALYGTYPAGDGPDWGWRIELDTRDPEHLTLRMFNLFPSGEVYPAVDLRGERA